MSAPKPTLLPAVDTYVERARPFAQPILRYLRERMHEGVPGVEEQIKWSRPFFVSRGVILANMAAFQNHCTFGLWGTEMAAALRADGLDGSGAMGSFGRITSVEDLPPAEQMEAYLRRAAELIATGQRTQSLQRAAKPSRKDAVLPAAFAAALATNPFAAEAFARLSPSCRREYAEWISQAKREDTRERRIASALQTIAEGKSRNWRYGKKS